MEIKTLEIVDHPGFFARSDGAIIGKRGKPMVGHIDHCGYHEVLFFEHGKTCQYRTHRLILETFRPRPNMKTLQVNHINGNKADNRLENLEWCTRSENLIHAYKNGLEKKCTGYKHHAHALSKEMVEDIRLNCKPNVKNKGMLAFARKYGVHYQTVSDAFYGRTYNED